MIDNKSRSSDIDELIVNNSQTNDPMVISNSMNKDIPTTPTSPMEFLGMRIEEHFKVVPVNITDVMILLLQLDDSKSPGPDDVPIKLIKIAAPLIAINLVNIFNLSLSSGQFPNLMKLAKVIPIFKAGEKSNMNNYRPISLLPIFS